MNELGAVDPRATQELSRLVAVMQVLRTACPWDAEQTHRTLATYLVEETGEVLDAIEAGTPDDLREELGDLLLQVVFHAEIAARAGQFSIADVARGISDKLIRRHPYVFADAELPDDLRGAWEARKRREKQRTSALDGIPERMSAVSRTQKVISRSRSHRVEIDLPDESVTAAEVGERIVALVSRAQASGVDAEQATRDALRELEARVRAAESSGADDRAETGTA